VGAATRSTSRMSTGERDAARIPASFERHAWADGRMGDMHSEVAAGVAGGPVARRMDDGRRRCRRSPAPRVPRGVAGSPSREMDRDNARSHPAEDYVATALITSPDVVAHGAITLVDLPDAAVSGARSASALLRSYAG
jgi:hypothetical protein